MSFFMGSMLLLAGVGDLRMLLRGGVFGRRRVVRHLWRMCLGFFIATGSFFLGQRSKMFPSVFHDSPLLLIPAFFAVDVVDFLVGAGPFYDRVEKDVCTARRSFVRYDDGSWLMR